MRGRRGEALGDWEAQGRRWQAREERARALRPVQNAAAAVARRAALDLTVVPPLPPDAILRATCDVEGNRRDPFGDGDQSLLRIVDPRRTPITDPEMQALKNLWCDAGDFFPAFFAAINACGSTWKGLSVWQKENKNFRSTYSAQLPLRDAAVSDRFGRWCHGQRPHRHDAECVQLQRASECCSVGRGDY